jgi:acylglycerol lipase
MYEAVFKNDDGFSIFTRIWPTENNSRGVVIIVPGFNAHSGYYNWAVEKFVSNGLTVYSLDLRGRGNSEGERFYVKSFDDYVNDVKEFVEIVKASNPGLPIFLLGHSAGGVVACLYALEHQDELTGLICESFAFQVPAPGFALSLFKGLEHIIPHAKVLRLKNNDFSRDPKIVELMNNDPLIARETQPTQTLAELIRADEKLKKESLKITLPIFILHGTGDKTAKSSGSEFFFNTVGSTDKSIKLYYGGFHDLLNDVDKETVLADIQSWIDQRVPQNKRFSSIAV